jgi:hypothetical protein
MVYETYRVAGQGSRTTGPFFCRQDVDCTRDSGRTLI